MVAGVTGVMMRAPLALVFAGAFAFAWPLRGADAASTIRIVPKNEKRDPSEPRSTERRREDPKQEAARERRPAPRALTAEPTPVFQAREVLPWVGIGASIITAIVGGVLLSEAAGALDADRFTFDAEERSNGTIDVDITDEFRDAQEEVVIKGFTGTFLASTSATLLTISLVELFRARPAKQHAPAP